MFAALFINFQYFHNPILISIVLFLLVTVLICFRFWNYIRVCYFASKLPGPTAYPIIGNVEFLVGSMADKTKYFINIPKQYQNSVFRLWMGPMPLIIIPEPEIIQEILTNKHALEKLYIMKVGFHNLLGKSILTTEVPEWKFYRNITIKAFSPIILKRYFKIFVEKINILTQNLDLEVNKDTSFDIFEYLSKTTVDSACGSTMGVNTNSFEESSYLDAMESAVHLTLQRLTNIFKFPNIIYHFTEDYKKFSKCRQIVKQFAEKIISEKRKIYNNNIEDKVANDNEYLRKPFLEYFMDFTKNNPNISDEQLRNETSVLIFGAYDTTAVSLSFVLLQLAADKNIQNEVHKEILGVLKETNSDSISFDDLPKLKYMEMVIKESMRLHATFPAIGRELSQDIKIGKHVIPKGANVIIPIVALHRNTTYWKNPMKFDPNRFTPENINSRHPFTYIPFSAGPRNCLGMRYAWILMKLTLATLLMRYEFHTDLNLNDLKYEFAATMKLVNGFQVQITQRPKPNE